MADGSILRAALRDTGHSDRYGFESEQGGRRNGSDPLYGGGVLSAAAAAFGFRSGDGAAVSSVCYFDTGAEYADEIEFRDGICAYRTGIFDEPSQYYSACALQKEKTMVGNRQCNN